MKCYASEYCQKDKSSCSEVCGAYRVLRALYNLSRLPENYRYNIALKPANGEDLEAFKILDDYKQNILTMVEEGKGLYIWYRFHISVSSILQICFLHFTIL